MASFETLRSASVHQRFAIAEIICRALACVNCACGGLTDGVRPNTSWPRSWPEFFALLERLTRGIPCALPSSYGFDE
jgi:hypothetical protein